ncbi:MAG: hypothetical protein ABJM58_03320 [Alteripontixanthobacter sp.]
MGRLGFGFGSVSRGVIGAGLPPAPPQPGMIPLAIDNTGWRASVDNPADLTLQPIELSRAGFDGAGAPATWDTQLLLTKRVRQPFPDHTQFTPGQVAISDYVYASDTLTGVANNSLAESPLPIAQWVMPSREVVADTVAWEVVAFHRDARADPVSGKGRQVACVRVRASNGGQTTAWQAVSATSISALCTEGCPLEVYSGALDITALNDGMFWLEAEILPWFGTAASVLRSEDNTQPREFSRRYFLKDAVRAAAPPLVYVASSGSDGSGAVSADPAIASASPCLTVGGALARARAQLGATQGSLDGLRIRVMDSVQMGSVPYQANYPQDVGAIVVERAPATARADAVIAWSTTLRFYFKAHTAPITEGALTFREVTIDRQAATTIYGEAANQLLVQFHDVVFANHANAGTLRANTHLAVFGMAITGYSGTFSLTTSGEIRMLRGVVGDLNNGGPEAWVTVACELTRANACFYADPAKGAIFASNRYLSPTGNTGPLVFTGTTAGGDIGPLAIVQNLIEVTHTVNSSASVRLSADDDFGNIANAVILHNTTTGIGQLGRWNVFYDEHPTVAREHRLIACKGNLVAQLNTKSDIFQSNGTRQGNFAFSHGVGCAGNYAVFDANAPDSEHQDYAGPGSKIGGGPPAYVAYRGTSGTQSAPVAGQGGGDYRLDPASNARGILAEPLLAFDLNGAARGNAAQAAGAYA